VVDDPTPATGAGRPDPERHFETGHLKRDLGSRAARGAALTLASNGVRFLIEAARIIVLARLLSPADYGLVAMVTVVTGFIGMFQDLGLNLATVTRDRINHAQVSTLFWVNVAVGVLLVAATAALAPVLAWFYSEPRLVAITLAVAPTFLIVSLTVQHQALLRRQMRFGISSVIAIVSSLVGLLVGILMAWWGSAYWALVAMTIAVASTNLVAAWIAAPWRPGRPMRRVGTRELVRFGTHVTGTNLLNYFSRRLDHLLLGWWWGATVLGLYTKANSLVETPWNRALIPVGSVVIPSLSRLAGEPERYRASFLRILEKLALVVLPGAAFMIASAQWLIPFLLGERWAEAAPIFGALAVLGLARPIEVASLWLFMTQNRADQALRWSTFGGLIAAVAVLVGLPWGGVGVAVALAAVGLARIPLLVWYVTRSGPIRASDIYRSLSAPAFASAAALLVLVLLNPKAAGMPPALVLGAGLSITGAVVMAILCILPSGRSALADAWSLLQLLRRQRPA
jgi:PST family polysaccharide transporter